MKNKVNTLARIEMPSVLSHFTLVTPQFAKLQNCCKYISQFETNTFVNFEIEDKYTPARIEMSSVLSHFTLVTLQFAKLQNCGNTGGQTQPPRPPVQHLYGYSKNIPLKTLA